MKESGRRASRVDGRRGVVPEQHAAAARGADEVIASVRDGRCRLLYVSPERLVGDGGPVAVAAAQAGRPEVHRDRRRRTASASGGTTFRPEYRQLGKALREDFPRRFRFQRLHGDRHRAGTARTSSASCGSRSRWWLVGSFDSARTLVYPRESAAAIFIPRLIQHPRSARWRIGDRLLLVAQGKWKRSPSGLKGEGPQRRCARNHAGFVGRGFAAGNQEMFLDERVDIVVATVCVRDGHRSVERALRRARRGRRGPPEHYQQESGAAPAGDGLPAECVLIYSGGDFRSAGGRCSKSNGEWSESARHPAARTWRSTRAGTPLPSSDAGRVTSASHYERADCGAVPTGA